MRKNILSTLAVIGGCILLFSSCEKREDGLVIDNSKGGKIFTATMPTVEETPESRTSTSDGRSVIWNEGDTVSLFNGKNVNEKYGVKEGEGGKASTTLVKVTDSDSPAGSDATFDANIAYYPYGTVNYTGNGSNHSLEVTIPNVQTYAQNSFGKGALPMVAVTASKDDDNLQFKNLFGLIKLQLKGSDGVDRITGITIKGNNGEKLSGKATVSCSNTTAPTVSFGGADVYDYVKLDCADGVAISKTTATAFWVALPPVAFSNGITVTVELGDGRTVTKSTNRALTIDRSKVTPMAALTFTRENARLNVPDPAFRAYLLAMADMDNDGILTLQDAQAWNESSREKSFDVRNKNITSLKGIEHFTALTSLNCAGTPATSGNVHTKDASTASQTGSGLTELDITRNTALKELDCSYNNLTALDLSNNPELTKLDCSGNQITELDLSNNPVLAEFEYKDNPIVTLVVTNNNAMTELDCSNKNLTTLDVSNCTALKRLNCSGNQLTELDVSKNTALTRLECYSNQLTSLDVSKNTALTYLSCSDNKLTTIDVSNCTVLNRLGCSDNQLTELDLSNNTALKRLVSSRNQLKALDVCKNISLDTLLCFDNQLTILDVSKNTALTALGCGDNQLTTLDVSKNTTLTYLSCGSNQLKALDVSNNTALTFLSCGRNQLTDIDVSKNAALTSLSCNYNQLATLDVSNCTALTKLLCFQNQLKTLNVSKNTALTFLSCNFNQLTTLDLSKNTALTDLSCYGNQLTTLDVSNNTVLETLHCTDNQLTTLDVSKTNLNKGETGTDPTIVFIIMLSCRMSTLKTLYLKTGWVIYGINNNRSDGQIHPDTVIEYKD